ncbi:DUF92 domain-containing protein [Chondrinema litorale]|uniref:DUF92 domain-containing protein n=1 Tax=Chondrinema litorale TaxID=2994555 RepID=UPI002542EBF9|nr:DUF92 domain-containing protein [Chondrinema litorale]UZR93190.1 DUF92 domain-containing protein [Chondrinema litorale]
MSLFQSFFSNLAYVLPALPSNFLLGVLVVILFAVLSVLSGKIDVPGGLTGGLLAFCLFLGGGFLLMGYLFLFFIAGSAASAFKIGEKQKLGLAEKNKGKRSYNNALANAGVAAIFGILCWADPNSFDMFHLMLAASFASAASDTFSSELGNYFGKNYYNIITLKPDERGLDGVVSLEGTLAGVVGSVLISLYFYIVNGRLLAALIVLLAGIFGNFTDSVLGATLQKREWLNNDTVNFANTLLASLFAMLLYNIVA